MDFSYRILFMQVDVWGKGSEEPSVVKDINKEEHLIGRR